MINWLLLFALSISANAETTSAEFKTPSSTKTGELFGIGNLESQVKSQAELDQYFQCHIATGKTTEGRAEALKRYGDFKAKTQNYIKWAAREFGMPSALSQCMMFRESFFDNTLESSKNAVSMAQIRSNTYGRILDRIEKDRATIQFEHEYNDLVKLGVDPLKMTPEENSSDNYYIRWMQFANRTGPYYNQASQAEKDKYTDSIDELEKYKAGKSLYENYQNYLKTAFNNLPASEKKNYFPNSKNKIAPEDLFPSKDVTTLQKNPILMTGIQMYYLSEMMMRTDYRLNDKLKKSNDPMLLMLLIAGGYNAGDNAMLNALKDFDNKTEATSVQDWCYRLRDKGGEEVTNYMLSIRRCLMRNDNREPTRNDPSDSCNGGSIYQAGTDPCVPSSPVRPKERPKNL